MSNESYSTDCSNCGSSDTVIVWRNPTDYHNGSPPDYLHCNSCKENENIN